VAYLGHVLTPSPQLELTQTSLLDIGLEIMKLNKLLVCLTLPRETEWKKNPIIEEKM